MKIGCEFFDFVVTWLASERKNIARFHHVGRASFDGILFLLYLGLINRDECRSILDRLDTIHEPVL